MRVVVLSLLALNTGMRRGELAGLQLFKVDFQHKLIPVARQHNREGFREMTKTSFRFRDLPIRAEDY
jgi:integrase